MVVFFSAVSSVLYYVGVMQVIIKAIYYMLFSRFCQILPVVVFFSTVSSVLYYVGVMQVIIKAIYYMLFSPFCPDITNGGIL